MSGRTKYLIFATALFTLVGGVGVASASGLLTRGDVIEEVLSGAPDAAVDGLETALYAPEETQGNPNGPPDNVPVGPPDWVTTGKPDKTPVGPPDWVTRGKPDEVPPGPPDWVHPGQLGAEHPGPFVPLPLAP